MTERAKKIRTVKVNARGQLVIPEDVRNDLDIAGDSTLVLIEQGDEIVLRKESHVLQELDDMWRVVSHRALARAWDAEDDVWDEHYAAESA